jgi:Ca2+-binding EF-hand superfamily protein
MASGTTSLLIALGSLNYLSGSAMRARASERLEQIETLSNALSDICALDYVIKVVEKGHSLDKDQFREVLQRARQSKVVDTKEVDLLFNVFDRVKDGYIRQDDFQVQKEMKPSRPIRETENR